MKWKHYIDFTLALIISLSNLFLFFIINSIELVIDILFEFILVVSTSFENGL